MRLGKYARQARLGKAKANTKWAPRGRRQGSVVITASVTKAIEIPIEAHQRNNERLRSQHFPLQGYRYVPHPPAHAHSRFPVPEFDGRTFFDDHRESHRPARLDMFTCDVADVDLPSHRPVNPERGVLLQIDHLQ